MGIKMPRFFSSSTSSWELYPIIVDICMTLRPFTLILWFTLAVTSMTLATYLNVCFLSTITVNVAQGLKYLSLLLMFESATAYFCLKQSEAEKFFILDFVKHFQTRLNQRILGSHWIKIKLSDQVEIRRKLEEASDSVKDMLGELIDQLREMSKFLTTVTTILYMCPIATVLIGIVYIAFYRLHLSKQSAHLLEVRRKMIATDDRLSSKYARTNANMFEYVIHHEKNKVIDITNALKIGMERQWFLLNYLYNFLSFEEDILGKLCTFAAIVIHCALSGANAFILPLYYYLSSLTGTLHTLLCAYIRWVRLKRNYDLVMPILEEYEERMNVEQIELTTELQIRDLSFHYQGKRDTFCLRLADSLTFTMGEAILITGKSGAGNAVSPSSSSNTRMLF